MFLGELLSLLDHFQRSTLLWRRCSDASSLPLLLLDTISLHLRHEHVSSFTEHVIPTYFKWDHLLHCTLGPLSCCGHSWQYGESVLVILCHSITPVLCWVNPGDVSYQMYSAEPHFYYAQNTKNKKTIVFCFGQTNSIRLCFCRMCAVKFNRKISSF